jgi:hypothetical protein
MMWKFYPAVEEFLDALKNTEKIFMYNTSDSTRMQYGTIDTITSASTEVAGCASALGAVIERAVRAF